MHKNIGLAIYLVFVTLSAQILQSQGRIKPHVFPQSMSECVDKAYKSKALKNEAAETIIVSCVSRYIWRHVNIPCTHTSNSTLKFLAGIADKIEKYAHESRHKRQASWRQRKEIRAMSAWERDNFFRACNMLKRDTSFSPNLYDLLASFHEEVRNSAHFGPGFLPWHRLFLFMFEEILRSKVPGVTIPYWDSTLDSNMYSAGGQPQDSVLWTGGFYGNGNGFVQEGPFAWQTPYGPLNRNHASGGRLITSQDVNALFSMQSGGQVAAFLEDIHNSVHNWVGGDMSNIRISPVDPIFYMHHAYVDYLWWQWQRRVGAPRAYEYPSGGFGDHSPDAPLMHIYLGTRYTNADGYSARWANMVSYEGSPSCSAGNCNSRYLQCNPGGCASRNIRRQQNARPLQQQQQQNFFGRKRRSVDLPLHAYPDLHKALNEPKLTSKYSTNDILPTKSEPVNDNTCYGFSVQNDFRINCKADYNLWAFLPIKIIHLRPAGKVYNSYLVKNGKPDYTCDLYSSTNSSSSSINSYIKPQSPSCYKYCQQDESGIFRATIKSFGINYVGYFTDYVILDNRQPVDAKISYIGFRKPTQKASKVFLSVFDHCGRICRPKCLVPGSNPPVYRSCSGLLNINRYSPKFYGNTYQKAVLNYWKFNMESSCPTQKETNVFVVFYCDYKRDWWPWRGCKVRNGSWKYTYHHKHHYQYPVKY